MKFPFTPETIEQLNSLWYIFNAMYQAETAELPPRMSYDAQNSKKAIETNLKEGNLDEALRSANELLKDIEIYRKPPHCCSCRCNDD